VSNAIIIRASSGPQQLEDKSIKVDNKTQTGQRALTVLLVCSAEPEVL
jgi:hypothetical protein